MLNDTQKKVLEFVVSALQSAGVPFQATGGLAAIVHGGTRPLYDIDIDIRKQDIEKVRELFAEYIVEDWNNDLEGEDDLFDIWMMKLEIEGVPIDISQIEDTRVRTKGGPWTPLPASFNPEEILFQGLRIPTQGKESLIAYKKLLGRDTDLIDIGELS